MEHPQTNTACDDCVKILEAAAALISLKSEERPTMILFHTSYQMRLVANMSSSKCHMCTLLGGSIPRLLEPPDSKELMGLAITRDRHDPDATTVTLCGRERDGQRLQATYRGSLRIQDIGHRHVCVLNSPKTWSLETLSRIQSWLKSCTLSHENCVKPQVAKRLPRRLIDVMPTASGHVLPVEEIGPEDFNSLSLEESPSVRIISSNSLPFDTPYITLSHRWGNPPGILLTQKTLFLLSDDITSHLANCRGTAVFRHAIHVTRGLGFRYIWIDALCIMQDDEFEKTTDIMQMDEIYSNSTLNISATEGRIREGLVFDRENLFINPCRVIVRVPGAKEDMSLYSFPEKWFLRPWEGPLNKRGWVFQERTLAPRIIHFTKDQVFWECHSLEASEILPQGVPGPSTPPSKGIKISLASSIQQLKSQWYEVVDAYSHTSLTFVEDRLLAISAVAKLFCSAMLLDPSEYLAGMWKSDLPLSMLWYQDRHTDKIRPDPTANIATGMKHAPSWSWASALGPIGSVELSSLVAITDVLDIQIGRVSPNFFDGVDFCRLRLRGPVCQVRRRIRNCGTWIYVAQDTEFQEFGHFDFQQGKAIIIEWDISRGVATDCFDSHGGKPVQSTYFLLHIASERSVDGPIERGVVLHKTVVRGTYIRIGSFLVPFKSEYPGSELEGAFNGRLDTLSTDDYLDLDSSGRYTIDVV